MKVNEITLSSTLTSLIGINRATLSSINEITTLVKPTPSSQLNDCKCRETSQVLSS